MGKKIDVAIYVQTGYAKKAYSFDVKRLFGAYKNGELPTEYLKTYIETKVKNGTNYAR